MDDNKSYIALCYGFHKSEATKVYVYVYNDIDMAHTNCWVQIVFRIYKFNVLFGNNNTYHSCV